MCMTQFAPAPSSRALSSHADGDDPVQFLACRFKDCGRYLLPRVRSSATVAPGKGFGLMRQHVTNLTLGRCELDGKWVGFVAGRVRHRQSNDQVGPFIEGFGRQDQHRVFVLHFRTDLRIEIDPDHVAAIWHPQFAWMGHQNTSAPTRPVAMTSPP